MRSTCRRVRLLCTLSILLGLAPPGYWMSPLRGWRPVQLTNLRPVLACFAGRTVLACFAGRTVLACFAGR